MTIHSHPSAPTTCSRCGEPVAVLSVEFNGWINMAPHECRCKCDNEDPYVCKLAKPQEHEPCYCSCHKL